MSPSSLSSLDVVLKSEVWLRLNHSSVITCKNKYTLNIQWNIRYHIKIKETVHNEEVLQSETHSHWASSHAGATSSAFSVGAIHCSLVHSPSSSSSWQSSQGSHVSHISGYLGVTFPASQKGLPWPPCRDSFATCLASRVFCSAVRGLITPFLYLS